MNSAWTRSACVCRGNLPPARWQRRSRGSSGLKPAAIASAPCLILITSRRAAARHQRYSALPLDDRHGMPRSVAASSRQRTGLPTCRPRSRRRRNTCRLERMSEMAKGPAGIRFRSRTRQLDAPGRSLRRHVELGPQREADPGTSASGAGPARRAVRSTRRTARRECVSARLVGRPADRRPGREDRRRTQRVRQPAEVRRRANSRGHPCGTRLIGPAARRQFRQNPPEPHAASRVAPLSRRACAARSGTGPPRPRQPAAAPQPPRPARATPRRDRLATTSHPNGRSSSQAARHQAKAPSRSAPSPRPPPPRPRKQPSLIPGDLRQHEGWPRSPASPSSGSARHVPRRQREHHLSRLSHPHCNKRIPADNPTGPPQHRAPTQTHRPSSTPGKPA